MTRKITEDIDKVEPEADSSFDYLQAVEKNNKENNGECLHIFVKKIHDIAC